MSRLEELLKCKRMDYGYPVDGNLLHGLYDLVCDNITNLNFSLCQSCYDSQLAENKKKYSWPFVMQSIRFDN